MCVYSYVCEAAYARVYIHFQKKRGWLGVADISLCPD
jgi:hypothetical protein